MLLELDAMIPDEECIKPVFSLEKHIKNAMVNKEMIPEYGQAKKTAGKTLVKGYVNRNIQE